MKSSYLLNVMAGLTTLLAAMPASSNYTLRNYNYGSGGNSSSSSSYSLNATTGQVSNTQSTSATYKARPGEINVQQAYVPAAPTFTNPSNYYNKLHFVVNPGTSPSDTKFTIAISSDNFVTTQYVQSDDTVGAAKVIGDYQTYTAWGGASGQNVIGLTPGTTYQIKVNAMQGNFTETEYGPTASAATVPPSLTFDIDVSPIDTSTSPPYVTTFPNLLPGVVTTDTDKVWISLDTNANSGGMVYIQSAKAGLKSNTTGVTIASASADLSVASTGYGVQGSTATQTSGGPLSISAPYNVTAQNVGFVDTALRQLFSSPAPITAGRGSVFLKAKSAASTPAAADYQDVLTLVAAGSF